MIFIRSLSQKKKKNFNMFDWFARDNKILTLGNLALRRCNLLHSITCVMCHADVESADHLLIYCPVASSIWNYFTQLLGLNQALLDCLLNCGGSGGKPLESLWFFSGTCSQEQSLGTFNLAWKKWPHFFMHL